MNSLALILTPLALLLPIGPAMLQQDVAIEQEQARAAPDEGKSPRAFSVPQEAPLRLLEEAREPEVEGQVSIQQRVIIRIAPSTPQRAEQSLAELNRRSNRFERVRMKGCVPINMIAAVAPDDNRLLLFMRDRQILSATLERACNPDDFYSGFYVERQDGQICVDRDRLQSRAGASCQVSRIDRLVAARD